MNRASMRMPEKDLPSVLRLVVAGHAIQNYLAVHMSCCRQFSYHLVLSMFSFTCMELLELLVLASQSTQTSLYVKSLNQSGQKLLK